MINGKRYDRAEVTHFAIQLKLIRGLDEEFEAIMRAQFPGISSWMLREVEKDAKLVVAIRAGREEGE